MFGGLGRCLGHQEDFFVSFSEALKNPLPSPCHLQAMTESFTLLEGKIFTFLLSPKVIDGVFF